MKTMLLTVFKSKIHRATVTQADLNYTGSLTVDPLLLEAAGMLPYEQIHVLNINTGARFTTYLIEGERGAGTICLNGAAARLGAPGNSRKREAACQTFRHGDKVRFNAVMIHREQFTGTGKPGLHFISDQQNAVFIAQGSQRLHKFSRRRIKAPFALNRLQ